MSGFSVAHLPVCPSCSALSGDSGSGRTGAIILPWHFPIVKRFFAIFSLKYHFWRFLQFLYRKAIVLTVFFLMFIQCVKPFAAKKSQCVFLFPVLLILSPCSSFFSCQFLPHPFQDLAFPARDLYLRCLEYPCRLTLRLSPKETQSDQKPVLRRQLVHHLIQTNFL